MAQMTIHNLDEDLYRKLKKLLALKRKVRTWTRSTDAHAPWPPAALSAGMLSVSTSRPACQRS